MYGELVPIGGGDTIPLLKPQLMVGRRESCDIILRFPNVSAHHCELTLVGGYWFVKDLQSRNGVKVNEIKVTEKRMDPGDAVSIAKHHYHIQYDPEQLGAIGPPPTAGGMQEILGKSLLERAGLTKGRGGKKTHEEELYEKLGKEDQPRRYDPNNNSAGQIKDPNKPL
jgi:adenylate cyclase